MKHVTQLGWRVVAVPVVLGAAFTLLMMALVKWLADLGSL